MLTQNKANMIWRSGKRDDDCKYEEGSNEIIKSYLIKKRQTELKPFNFLYHRSAIFKISAMEFQRLVGSSSVGDLVFWWWHSFPQNFVILRFNVFF